MKDQFQRTIDYARISITDRCNLYCTYCRPDHEEKLSHKDILRYEDLRSQVENHWYEKAAQILFMN